jgi:acetyl/propionyl-CoA carboxylase alpha subunit
MHESAVKLAEIVKYTSAGTVEFMLTESKGKQDFFFLEMNTRLQVEHPVTEEVFGIDLVEQQLRVAEGLALSDNLLVSDLQPSGHAIEVRVYGEDVHKDFLPTAGEVCYFSPSLGEARWEIGLDHCGQVTSEFDPMIPR